MEEELKKWHDLHIFHLNSGNYETKDLADYVGVSSRTIQRWLKDLAKPTREQLVRVKQYLSGKSTH